VSRTSVVDGTGMDIEAVIAEMEARRLKLDRAIGALREIYPAPNGSGAIASPEVTRATPAKRQTARKPATPKAKAVRASKTDWELGRKLWTQNLPTAEIAKRLGVSTAGVHYQAGAKKWPKRDRVRANPEQAAAPEPAEFAAATPEPAKPVARPVSIAVPRPAEGLKQQKGRTALRRCDTCGLVTERDPCDKCQKPMKEWKGVFSR
jgi:hypothetical protein